MESRDTPEAPSRSPAEEEGAAPAPPRPLRLLAIRGSFYTFLGYGIAQVIRFGGNVILTTLLFREAFGLMVMINVFLQGLAMLTDLGIAPSIVQNPEADEPEFLRTAWTLQIVRGIGLWLGALALSYPAAWYFGQPALRMFLPVAGLNLLIVSLDSTNFHLLQRRLHVGLQTLLIVSTQIVGLIVSVSGALLWRMYAEIRTLQTFVETLATGGDWRHIEFDDSFYHLGVWALVGGTLVGVAFRTALTYRVPGPRMGFAWRKEYVDDLIHFGKWIFVSTLLTFVANNFDRAVLARFLDVGMLGVYGIAFMFANVVVELLRTLSNRVLFPVYAEMARRNPEILRKRSTYVRMLLMLVTLPVLWGMVLVGPEFIRFVYKPEYWGAGPLLQLLACGAILTGMAAPVEIVFLAVGDSFRHFLSLLSRSITLLSAMAVGGYLNGSTGIIWGIVLAPGLYYPFLSVLGRRYRVWVPWLDALGLVASAAVLTLGLWVKQLIVD
jgi:O-antigen/teichoic acid export membrane protein